MFLYLAVANDIKTAKLAQNQLGVAGRILYPRHVAANDIIKHTPNYNLQPQFSWSLHKPDSTSICIYLATSTPSTSFSIRIFITAICTTKFATCNRDEQSYETIQSYVVKFIQSNLTCRGSMLTSILKTLSLHTNDDLHIQYKNHSPTAKALTINQLLELQQVFSCYIITWIHTNYQYLMLTQWAVDNSRTYAFN